MQQRTQVGGGEEWRLTGRPAGQKVDFPHLPHLLFMWDRPLLCPPTQHLVSLFCIKVRGKDTVGQLAAPPEERCGEVTWMADEESRAVVAE